MLCRVEMPTNDQIYGRFYRWRMLHQGGKMLLFSLFGLPVLILAAVIFFWLAGERSWLLIVLFVAMLGYDYYVFFYKPTQIFNKIEGAALQTEVTIFTDNGFTRGVRDESGSVTENISHRYTDLVSAVETTHDFYLFYTKANAYTFDKEYFTNGTPEELRATLKEQLGAKFKSKG